MSIVHAVNATQSTQSKRATLNATCPDYNEARRALKFAIAKPFAWIEAVEMPEGVAVWPTRPDGVAYAVHSASSERDVPTFAIEVYESGALSRYEAERSKIAELAKMSEADRLAALRAQNARVEIPNGSVRSAAALRM